jgi:hypothetical protein
VGDVEMEQNPVGGRVRFTLIISESAQAILGTRYVTVSGEIVAVSPKGVKTSSHYSPHFNLVTYHFHSSLANVAKGSKVTVTLSGNDNRISGVIGFNILEVCRTILGP